MPQVVGEEVHGSPLNKQILQKKYKGNIYTRYVYIYIRYVYIALIHTYIYI